MLLSRLLRHVVCRRVFFGLSICLLPLILLAGYIWRYQPNNDVQFGHRIEYPALDINKLNDGDLVKRGEYLAKIGNCISCHTSENGDHPFAGGLKIETPYGQIYSSNITFDKDTGIGHWGLDDFSRAMHQGVSPSGKHYYPVFPYPYFSHLTASDTNALYHYLKAIPTVYQKNKSPSFPFNLPLARRSMALWDQLFLSSGTVTHSRGEYLVEGLGHCGLCHSPLNRLGAENQYYHLSGRFVQGYWAPDISSLGLADVSSDEIGEVFTHHRLLGSAGPIRGPMMEVTLNSLHYLTDKDKLAVAMYLKTLKTHSPQQVSPSQAPPNKARGRKIYSQSCGLCHDKGMMGAPRIGNQSTWRARLRENELAGLYRHTIDGFNSMPKLGACVGCSRNDIESAVNYILVASLTYRESQVLQKKINALNKI